jgi:hypothetical protein
VVFFTYSGLTLDAGPFGNAARGAPREQHPGLSQLRLSNFLVPVTRNFRPGSYWHLMPIQRVFTAP